MSSSVRTPLTPLLLPLPLLDDDDDDEEEDDDDLMVSKPVQKPSFPFLSGSPTIAQSHRIAQQSKLEDNSERERYDCHKHQRKKERGIIRSEGYHCSQRRE